MTEKLKSEGTQFRISNLDTGEFGDIAPLGDDFASGLKRMPDIEIPIRWNYDFPAAVREHLSSPNPRNMRIYSERQRLFWLDWYPRYHDFEAMVTGGLESTDADGMATVQMSFTPSGVIRIVEAERWRKIGWYLMAKPYQRLMSFVRPMTEDHTP